MGLKDTVLGWFRSSPEGSTDELRDAEIDKKSDEYGIHRGDVETELRTRGHAGEFESDQDAPRR